MFWCNMKQNIRSGLQELKSIGKRTFRLPAVYNLWLQTHHLVPSVCSSATYCQNERRSWCKVNRDDFISALGSSELCDSTSFLDTAELHCSTLQSLADEFVPVRRVKMRRQPIAAWMDWKCHKLLSVAGQLWKLMSLAMRKIRNYEFSKFNYFSDCSQKGYIFDNNVIQQVVELINTHILHYCASL